MLLPRHVRARRLLFKPPATHTELAKAKHAKNIIQLRSHATKIFMQTAEVGKTTAPTLWPPALWEARFG